MKIIKTQNLEKLSLAFVDFNTQPGSGSRNGITQDTFFGNGRPIQDDNERCCRSKRKTKKKKLYQLGIEVPDFDKDEKGYL